MKFERINNSNGFCAKKSHRIPELHRNRRFGAAGSSTESETDKVLTAA